MYVTSRIKGARRVSDSHSWKAGGMKVLKQELRLPSFQPLSPSLSRSHAESGQRFACRALIV